MVEKDNKYSGKVMRRRNTECKIDNKQDNTLDKKNNKKAKTSFQVCASQESLQQLAEYFNNCRY